MIGALVHAGAGRVGAQQPTRLIALDKPADALPHLNAAERAGAVPQTKRDVTPQALDPETPR